MLRLHDDIVRFDSYNKGRKSHCPYKTQVKLPVLVCKAVRSSRQQVTYTDYNMSLRERELIAIVTKQPSLPEVSDVGLWLDHVFSAVEKKFGHVQITNLEEVKQQLEHFVDDLQFEVVDSGTKKDPNITQPCILDISYKKFCNNQGDSDNNSIVRITKIHRLLLAPGTNFSLRMEFILITNTTWDSKFSASR